MKKYIQIKKFNNNNELDNNQRLYNFEISILTLKILEIIANHLLKRKIGSKFFF